MRPVRLDERGSAVIELPLVIGLLLVPLALAVLAVPQVVERQMAARQAAREIAREMVLTGGADPAAILARVEAGHGLESGALRLDSLDLDGTAAGELRPGGRLVARTTVDLPLLGFGSSVALVARAWSAEHVERVPDHGARR